MESKFCAARVADDELAAVFVIVAGVPLTKLDLLRIVRPNEAVKLVGRSKPSIYRDIRAGRLPPWLKLGDNARGQHLGVLLRAYDMIEDDAH